MFELRNFAVVVTAVGSAVFMKFHGEKIFCFFFGNIELTIPMTVFQSINKSLRKRQKNSRVVCKSEIAHFQLSRRNGEQPVANAE